MKNTKIQYHPGHMSAMNSEFAERKLIDTELGLKYSAYNEILYGEIVQMFCNAHQEKKKKIEEYFSTKSWDDYVVQVHSMKSTALNVGAEMLFIMAKKLEEAGKERKIEYIMKHHGKTMELYNQTVKACKEILG